MTTDQGAREARYAEAIDDRRAARAVLPLVDAEVAAAVSEAQADAGRLRQAGESLAQQGFDALDRAESAEAEVERLREGIRALADEWETEARAIPRTGSGVDEGVRSATKSDAKALRALLPPSPAATTGEALTLGAGQGPSLGEIDPPLLEALRPLIARYGALGVKHTVDLLTDRAAPVSSGEAGTGEAAKPEWWDADHNRPADVYTPPERTYCHVCGVGYTLHVDSLCKRSESRGIRSPRPAPVVTPSAEGSET